MKGVIRVLMGKIKKELFKMYRQIYKNTKDLGIKNLREMGIPKPSIPVQVGVGSPSLIDLSSSDIFCHFPLSSLKFPQIKTSTRENLGKKIKPNLFNSRERHLSVPMPSPKFLSLGDR